MPLRFIMYFVVASTWRSNLRKLDQAVKEISFHDISRPKIEINDQLHSLRQKIIIVKSEVDYALRYMHPGSQHQNSATPRDMWPCDARTHP